LYFGGEVEMANDPCQIKNGKVFTLVELLALIEATAMLAAAFKGF